MLRAAARYFGGIPAVFIDGALYTGIAWFMFNQVYLGGDEAAKWMEASVKFWLNWVIGSIVTMLTAVKTFRSTGYAKHQEDKKIVASETVMTEKTTEVKDNNLK